VKNYR